MPALRAVVVLTLLCGACRGPRSADEAFLRAERAIAAGDARALYAVVDQDTRWAAEAAYKDGRLQRTLIEAKYPEAEQTAALARLQAATADDAAGFFARVAEERGTMAALRRRLGSVSGPIARKPDGEAVFLARQDGAPLRFHRNRDGSWGMTDLAAEWALERDRASHAVRTVRENAALYRKAEEK